MIITAIKIRRLINSNNKLIGLCSITLDDMIVIHDIKILRKEEMFLAMPSRKTQSNTFKDIVHPISVEPRTKIEEIVFGLFEMVEKSNNSTQDFKCVMKRESLLDQICTDFETNEARTHNSFIDEDIRKEIASWLS